MSLLARTALPALTGLTPSVIETRGRKFERPNTALAIRSESRDLVWDFNGPAQSEPLIQGDVAIVRVRGPLSHHPEWYFESYDEILIRAQKAFESQAKVVLVQGDTPGGEVSGCFTTARELRRLADAAGKPFVWFVDGMTCSAGLALAMACDQIYLPPEARFGSIGVIAELQSQKDAAEAYGLKTELITSGKAKADGHPLSEITDEVKARVLESVLTEASIFFNWVSERTSIPVDEIESWGAEVFHGEKSVSLGLCDGVLSFSGAFEMVSNAATERAPEGAGKEASMPGAINKASVATAAESGLDDVRKKLAKVAAEDSDEGRKARKALDAMDEEPKDDKEPKPTHEEPDGDEGETEDDETEASAAEETEEKPKAEDESDARRAEDEEAESKKCEDESKKASAEADDEDASARKALRAGDQSKALAHLNKATSLRNRSKSLKATAKTHRSNAAVFKSNAALATRLASVESRLGKRVPTSLPTHPAVAALSATGARGEGQGQGKKSPLANVPLQMLKGAGLLQGTEAASKVHDDGRLEINWAVTPAQAKARLAEIEGEISNKVNGKVA